MTAEQDAVQRIADLLVEIGESVEVYYEPRNEGMEWYVGFADPHGFDLPVHDHFGDLIEGLTWLSRDGVRQLEEEKTDLEHGLADETAMHELQKRVAARLRDRVLQREEALRLARNLAQGAADLAREALNAKENTREGDTMARLEMDDLRPVIRGLDTVRVKKDDLLAALKENKDEHRRIFTEAIDAWHKRVIERLEELVAQAKRGPESVELVVRLPRPADHTKEYERVIKMVELSQDDEFELTQQDFAQFVMDEWGWQRDFLAASAQFSELANDKMDKQGYSR